MRPFDRMADIIRPKEKGQGDNPSVTCGDSSLYTKEP